MKKEGESAEKESIALQGMEQGRFERNEDNDQSGLYESTEDKIFGKKAKEHREETLSDGEELEQETVLVCDLREAFSNYWSDYWKKLGLTPVSIDGASCFYNDLPLFRLKGVFTTDWVRFNPKQSCKEIARFYREKGGWFSWYLPESEDSEELRKCLYNVGLEPVENSSGWHTGSMQYPFVKIDPKFRLTHVDDAKKLGIFMCLLAQSRGYEAKEAGQLAEIFKTAGFRSGIYHFIGFYDGAPAGIVSFLRSVDRVCVYHLYVKESIRRKGIGRLLLQEMVGFANLFKIEKTVLVASGGKEFFRSCGFEASQRYLLYSARA